MTRANPSTHTCASSFWEAQRQCRRRGSAEGPRWRQHRRLLLHPDALASRSVERDAHVGSKEKQLPSRGTRLQGRTRSAAFAFTSLNKPQEHANRPWPRDAKAVDDNEVTEKSVWRRRRSVLLLCSSAASHPLPVRGGFYAASCSGVGSHRLHPSVMKHDGVSTQYSQL